MHQSGNYRKPARKVTFLGFSPLPLKAIVGTTPPLGAEVMSIVKSLRIERGLSQKELARKSGIDPRTLRKIEAGEHVSAVSLNAVERVLEASVTTETDKRETRQNLMPAKTFWFYASILFAASVIVTIVGYTDTPLTFGFAMFGLIYFLFGIPVAYMALVMPHRGNTRIDIDIPADDSDLRDPLNQVKTWLGREDVSVSDLRYDQDRFRFSAYVDYDVHEYPSIIRKLSDFGINVAVQREA